jgi:hypothetical protein
MNPLREDLEWGVRWEERGRAVHNVLGDTIPPNMVVSFSWKDYILPGACALTFGPTASRGHHLYMTLGLTQPIELGEPAYKWEFAVRAKEYAQWPVDLLYQFLTQWLWEGGVGKSKMGFGSHFPFMFFNDRAGNLWAGISDSTSVPELKPIGSIRGLYLWRDWSHTTFETSSGKFSLLTVIAVTGDEDRLADETTPTHLLLLLREMGVNHVCDPMRQSVLLVPEASKRWKRIKSLSHDDAYGELEHREWPEGR